MEGALATDSSSSASTLQDRIPVILTHEGVSSVWKQRAARGPATRDVDHRNRIAEHVERTLGTKIELFISERQPCHGLTVDVLVVPPTDERPFYVLVTRGLSEMHMNVHPLAKHSPSRIELVICLPKTWEVSLEAFRKSEQYFWPVRQLKRHALFPAIHHTFISLGHTVANELVNDDIPPSPDNPSRPFCSNTIMNSMLMMVPALLPEDFHIMTVKKPNKKKKKRSRKKDKTETSNNGQATGTAAAPANDDGTHETAAVATTDQAAGAAEGQLPPPPAQASTNESDGETNRQREQLEAEVKDGANNETKPDEGKEKENESEEGRKNEEETEVKRTEAQQQQQQPREGEEEDEEEEEAGEKEVQEPQQDGEKKKVRRRRGGKKKNKKNGENGKQGETEESKGKANDDNSNNGDGGKPKQRQKRNEEPFLYGENKEDVYFYQLLPLYQEEVDFKLKHGLDALLERLEQLPPLDVMTITPGRRNVCQMPVKRKILRAQRRASPKSAGTVLSESPASPSVVDPPRVVVEDGTNGGGEEQLPPEEEEKAKVREAAEEEEERKEAEVDESEASVKPREDGTKADEQVCTNGKGNEHK